MLKIFLIQVLLTTAAIMLGLFLRLPLVVTLVFAFVVGFAYRLLWQRKIDRQRADEKEKRGDFDQY